MAGSGRRFGILSAAGDCGAIPPDRLDGGLPEDAITSLSRAGVRGEACGEVSKEYSANRYG